MKLLQDNDSEKLWISKTLNNGDWNYYLVLRLQYMEEYVGEREAKEYGKYCVEIHAVSAEAAGKDKVAEAFRSWGFDPLPISASDTVTVEALLSYGISAPLFSALGNNQNKLLRDARKQIPLMNMLFGFYMDKSVNRIGNTGWDWIAGNIGYNPK